MFIHSILAEEGPQANLITVSVRVPFPLPAEPITSTQNPQDTLA